MLSSARADNTFLIQSVDRQRLLGVDRSKESVSLRILRRNSENPSRIETNFWWKFVSLQDNEAILDAPVIVEPIMDEPGPMDYASKIAQSTVRHPDIEYAESW